MKIFQSFWVFLILLQFSYGQNMELGIQYLNNGEHEKAIKEFTSFLKENSSNVKAIRLTGFAYKQLGRFKEAILFYEKILNIDPEDYDARLALARLYSWVEKFDKAEKYYLLILNNDSTDVEALNGLSDISLWTGKLDKAEWYAKRVLTFSPNNIKTFFRLANIYKAQGQLKKARWTYQRIANVDPTYAEIWDGLSQIAQWENRPFEAKRYLEKAIELDPSNLQYKQKAKQIAKKVRFQFSLNGGYIEEIEDIVEHTSHHLNFRLKKRLNDSWEIRLENREYFLKRRFTSDSTENSINYDVNVVSLAYLNSASHITAQVGYSVKDREFKNINLHGLLNFGFLPGMSLSFSTGHGYFYPWEDLFWQHISSGLRYRLGKVINLSAGFTLGRILNDWIYNENWELVVNNNDRKILSGGIDLLIHKPWQFKLILKYKFIDHQYISPFHYTPQQFNTYNCGFSFYKEFGSFYMYGQEIYGTNTDNVVQNVASLEGGLIFKGFIIGLNFFHFYNTYYENRSLRLLLRVWL